MENRPFFKKDIYLILLTALAFIGGSVILGVSLVYGFVGSILVSSLVLTKRGFTYKEIARMIFEGIIECRTLYILIIMIGATVSIWLSSGVVPVMIYYGFQYMKEMNFLLSAFLITSVMSIFMGTAVGTISTIGIALMGVGKGFGIPDGVLLGTIVSGAFLADKMSPLSGILNVTLNTTKVKYRSLLKSMLVTFIPVFTITAIVYYLIGKMYTTNTELGKYLLYQQAILDSFYVSPWLLLLPLGVVCMSVFGVKIIKTISVGLVGGILISATLQKMAVQEIFQAIFYGYKGATGSAELNTILNSGGIISMIEVLFIVAGAVSLSSILEKSGLVNPLVSKAISTIKTKGELVFKTGAISSVLTIITCDQTVGIILPGRLFKEKYDTLGVSQETLARTISDTGTVIAPLFPWNVNALIIGMITGIAAVEYIPYAVLCYVFPVVSILIAYGFRKNGHTIYKQGRS